MILVSLGWGESGEEVGTRGEEIDIKQVFRWGRSPSGGFFHQLCAKFWIIAKSTTPDDMAI
ncbi:MAG: hypothetical protein OHK0037_39920 [Elainellaceae cyanobacterium]